MASAIFNSTQSNKEVFRGFFKDADSIPQPKLSLETDGVSSRSSCESTPNTPSDQQSLRAPSNLINYDEAFEPGSRPDSFITWQLPGSPTEEEYEMYQTPNPNTGRYKAPPLNPAPRTKVFHGLEAAGSSIQLEEPVPNRAYHNRSPSQEPVTEPVTTFDGSDPSKCYDLIHEIVDYAWKLGKDTDKKWIARFAATRFTKRAVAWYSRLSDEVKHDWDELYKALIEKYPLPPTPDRPIFLSPTSYSEGSFTPTSTDMSPSSRCPSPFTATSILMPVTPYSGNFLNPPDVFVIPPNDDGRHTGPEPDHLSVYSTPKLSNTCLPESRGFHLTQNWQYGKIRVTGFGEVKPHYISKELNTLGGCWATSEKHEALCVKVRLGDCRNLYLENTPELHVKLGLTWDSINRHAPNLHRGSTDRANLVFLEEDGSSSARVFCGQTKDGIFTVERDNLVKISLPDDTRKERKLHVVVKAESRLKWPGRISLVPDDDAFTTRHHGYIRSELIFEPYT